MNPYYRPWQGWPQSDASYYGQSYHPFYPYAQNYNPSYPYTQRYYPSYPYGMEAGNPSYGFSQDMYTYSNPYVYGYGDPAYTENANTTGPAFNPQNFMSYFQDENGQMDLDKMMSTTGQVIKTVQQVSPIVKGIGTFMKGMK